MYQTGKHVFSNQKDLRERVTRRVFEEQTVRISDLATIGSTVAIASADRGIEYYLLEVKEVKDTWLRTHKKNSNVF